MRSKLGVVGTALLALIAPQKRTHGFNVLRGATSLQTQQTAAIAASRHVIVSKRGAGDSSGRRCLRARSSIVGEDAATGGASWPKTKPPLKVLLAVVTFWYVPKY